jgi:hypothetical protein
MASSTTNPVEIVNAMSERLSTLKPSRYMTPKVPMSDTGTATLGACPRISEHCGNKENGTGG